MEKKFRFGIMGPGNIAHNFCEAVKEQGQCEVAAVASRSKERAEKFAAQYGISEAYDSYEKMLQEADLDAVYISVTTNAHYDLAMLCLDYRMPVLCEKAMFTNRKDAREVFDRAKELGVFVMEGMWSRFLPKLDRVKEWLAQGRIGDVSLVTCGIGFQAPKDLTNRYYNPDLGGGATFDILVYCYEIATYFFAGEPISQICRADWAPSGVDRTDVVLLQYPGCLVELNCTFEGEIPEEMVFYGTRGKIVMPHPHYGKEAILYVDGEEPETFAWTAQNGFVYEIGEVIRCVREGRTESDVAPAAMTLAACSLYDAIYAQRP